ncbi:hypothetical protein GCM10010365_36660 [Streptomyces poonensis]|uniref:Uncharacterized protein n=1 Tax=Streptomyces poonensis TaxID=68255 RepID=A0A918UJ50_9ACTN|nr:hypothetical protein GCM10010365_36660 [Streptomyces poonensis]GLJ91214.1 hypothetical protein GCM10017589_38200 [Streptomyces poonensis]
MAVLLRFHDPLGDALDALGIGYGGASVLLHDKAHVRSSLSPSLSAHTHVLRSAQSIERPVAPSGISHGEMSRPPCDDPGVSPVSARHPPEFTREAPVAPELYLPRSGWGTRKVPRVTSPHVPGAA